jgi:hypothetical protein
MHEQAALEQAVPQQLVAARSTQATTSDARSAMGSAKGASVSDEGDEVAGPVGARPTIATAQGRSTQASAKDARATMGSAKAASVHDDDDGDDEVAGPVCARSTMSSAQGRSTQAPAKDARPTMGSAKGASVNDEGGDEGLQLQLIAGRRQGEKELEYECKWMGRPWEANSFMPRTLLVQKGFLATVLLEDDYQASDERAAIVAEELEWKASIGC